MGLELLICRLLVRRPPCCSRSSSLLHRLFCQQILCVSCGRLSRNLWTPKSLGSFFHFPSPSLPLAPFFPPSASLGCCHLIIEKLLLAACVLPYRRQHQRTMRFFRIHQQLCTYAQIKGLPRGMKSFRFFTSSIRVPMKRTGSFC